MSNTITQTTLSAAISPNQTTFAVASASNITAPVSNFFQQIYVIGPGQARGELMTVLAVSGTQVTVSRLDEFKAYWPSGSVVLIGPAPVSGGLYFGGGFQTFDPPGASATNNSSSSSAVTISPWVNTTTGMQWLFSTVLNCWVPGWQNPQPAAVTAAVASAAGQVTPSGPLFHITGALAITGFLLPTGFTHGSFTVIPDGTFTWTSANNIAISGTAVVNKALTFTWDGTNSLWVPSYLS